MRSLSRYGTSTLGTALLVGMLLAWPVQAQNWIWSTVNGKPYGPGLTLTGPIELANGTAAAPSLTFTNATSWGMYRDTSVGLVFSIDGASVGAFDSGGLSLGAGYTSFGASMASAADVFLRRDAANVLAQRNGTNAQEIRVWNTDGAADEFVSIGFINAANVFRFESEAAGGGTARPFAFAGGHVSVGTRPTVTVDAATTFAVASSYTLLACTGVETINTITGGLTGTTIWLENTDTECTIADDDDPTAANAVDLTGAATNDVGAVAKVIGLIYNGTSWLQIFESDN